MQLGRLLCEGYDPLKLRKLIGQRPTPASVSVHRYSWSWPELLMLKFHLRKLLRPASTRCTLGCPLQLPDPPLYISFRVDSTHRQVNIVLVLGANVDQTLFDSRLSRWRITPYPLEDYDSKLRFRSLTKNRGSPVLHCIFLHERNKVDST